MVRFLLVGVKQRLSKIAAKEDKAAKAIARGVSELGDFTADIRLVWLSALALIVGLLCALIAIVLLGLIGFFTNFFFYQRFSFTFLSPANNTLGGWEILIPAVGGLIIGLMARYGSERIRGHGIPEAMEAILIGQSHIQPRVAILKPLSSAISIGSGGPFGAEGPIIMTGGAFGSIIGQFLRLTASERKILLVAGAAGGMSATFASPVAAVLLAVELLLFEWKPRSMIPVAVASASAAILRSILIGPGPLFPTAPHPVMSLSGLLLCPIVGIIAGIGACLLTVAVYAAEDAFRRLPIHWMWWPVLGGLVVGVGGLFFPHTLGVGYDTIRTLISGHFTLKLLLAVLLVKAAIWAIALGSGTSGGVLAPLLMVGAALGGLEATVVPIGDPGVWALVSMAAILGGTMRSPFTGVIFALELTHDVNLLLPLLIACVASHGFTVLALRRSILTEKVARRGYHVAREYAVDPLEMLTVGKVMTRQVVTIPASITLQEAHSQFFSQSSGFSHQGYPVVDSDGKLVSIVTRSDLAHLGGADKEDGGALDSLIGRRLVVAFPDEPLRLVANRMIAANVGRLPVVSPEHPTQLVGILTRSDLLKARLRMMNEDERRERALTLTFLLACRFRRGTRQEEAAKVVVGTEITATEPIGMENGRSALHAGAAQEQEPGDDPLVLPPVVLSEPLPGAAVLPNRDKNSSTSS
ncbi:MAG TPA: chloride channel protein [Ktedonobacterales bacterium]|jgi:H+/Cl- antiporter ClcA/CBS domain-containing protein